MAPEGAASRAPSANFVSTAAALDENADLAAARVGAELQSFGALLAVHRQLCPSFCARAGGVAWRGVAWRGGGAFRAPKPPWA